MIIWHQVIKTLAIGFYPQTFIDVGDKMILEILNLHCSILVAQTKVKHNSSAKDEW